MPSILKSKTVWFAILVAVLSVLQGFLFLLPIQPLHQMLVGVVLAVCIVLLRLVTTEPVNQK